MHDTSSMAPGDNLITNPLDKPGALTFFDGAADQHLALAKHLTAEEKLRQKQACSSPSIGDSSTAVFFRDVKAPQFTRGRLNHRSDRSCFDG